MPKVTKEMGYTAALSGLVAVLVGLTTLWTFTERVFASEVREQVKQELAPVVETQKLLLESEISSRRLGIAAMEFKRDMCEGIPGCWTIRDAQDLTQARAELAAREQAMRALR